MTKERQVRLVSVKTTSHHVIRSCRPQLSCDQLNGRGGGLFHDDDSDKHVTPSAHPTGAAKKLVTVDKCSRQSNDNFADKIVLYFQICYGESVLATTHGKGKGRTYVKTLQQVE